MIATNLSVSYCSPSATTCSASGVSWPVENASYGSSGVTFTDALNNATTLVLGLVAGVPSNPSGVLGTIRPNDAAVGSDVTIANQATSLGPLVGQSIAITSVTDAAGTWTYNYVPTTGARFQMTVKDPLGHQRILYSSFNLNQVSSDTDANGHTTQYQYDTNYHLITVTHPGGMVDQFGYDSRGNVNSHTRVAAPGSGLPNIVESAVYPTTCASPASCNKPTAVIDANGHETDYTYDPNTGLMLTKVLPAGANGVRPHTSYVYQQLSATYYNASGQLAAGSPIWKLYYSSTCMTLASCVGTADEVRVSYGYDSNLRPTTITTAAGDGSLSSTVTNQYDAVGNLTSTTEPKGSANTPTTTVYIYDADRRKIGEIGPAPNGDGRYRATRTTYDKDGNVMLSEAGWTTSQSDTTLSSFTSMQQHAEAYDTIDRKVSESSTSGGTTYTLTQYNYDADSRLNCTAVRMNATTFGSEPDACSLGTTGSDGPDRISQNGYDPVGQVTSIVQGLGTANQRTYDAMSYGADGQKLNDTDANNNLTQYTYDGFDRLIQINYPNASGGGYNPGDYESYTLDAVGNMTAKRLRDGSTLNIGPYDALNRKQYDWNGAALGYDNLGHVTSASLNGLAVSMAYDSLGRKTSESSSLGTISYQYDLAGGRTRITWPDTFYVGYIRDTDEEVTQIEESGATSGLGLLASYSYDALGERTGISRGNGVSTSYGYDGVSRLNALSHTLVSSGYNQALGFTRNAAGQITGRSSTDSAYDWTGAYTVTRGYAPNGLNQLTTSGPYALSYLDGRGNLTSDSLHSYGYTPTNQLTSYSSGGVTAVLVYDPLGRLVQTGGSAAATTQFAYAGDQLLTEYDGSGNLLRRYVPGASGADDPVVWYEGASTGDRRWLIDDERGSVIGVTNAAGVLMDSPNTYDEYGNPGGSNQGRFQYTGQLWIPEIGLYHYKARTYSPTLGRFMQTDPIGYKDDLDLYAYVGDDPVDHTDPSGEACIPGVHSSFPRNQVGGRANPPCTGSSEDDKSDSQALRQESAQNSVMSESNLQPRANGAASHCSEGTCKIARAVGANTAPLGPSNGGFYPANQQVSNLAEESSIRGTGWHATNLASAQQLANHGQLVIIGWINLSGGSGHTVTVMRDLNNSHDSTNPTVAQIGGLSNGRMPFRNAFGVNKRDQVQVYVYTGQ